ncbi:L-rhamnose/proton symporter RhaT [Candidatus Neomarinimicrobiota bacterium]
MALVLGFTFVLIAGFFQGTFVLPMTLTKKWAWEHTWATFSLLGMLVFNWLLALLIFPNIFSIYGAVATSEIVILVLFGAGWGVGAILFGLGMDKLGMALGYPIIMGLIASLGALIPLMIFFPSDLLTAKGLVLLLGTAIVIIGIVLCGLAGARKEPQAKTSDSVKNGAFGIGLTIAILAGILSCLPNVGMAFGTKVIDAAKASGVSDTFAGNAVWALFFTMGFIVNFGYCLYLMIARKNLGSLSSPESKRNLGLGALMAFMWIGSFYLYGISTANLGRWGVIIGWPVFIALSIVVGNLWGLWRGEWKGAPVAAKSLLRTGMLVLIVAVITIAISNSL